MKRLSILLVIFLMLLSGCSSTKSTNTAGAKTDGFIFANKGTSIAMNAEVAPILKSLGKEKDYFEADSCAFQGKEKTYTYSGFELHTYEKNKVDFVASIIFLDDSVSTKEGISIASDINDVIKAYGDKYTEKSGTYIYEKGKSKLTFTVKDKKVSQIEYTAISE